MDKEKCLHLDPRPKDGILLSSPLNYILNVGNKKPQPKDKADDLGTKMLAFRHKVKPQNSSSLRTSRLDSDSSGMIGAQGKRDPFCDSPRPGGL